jgi:glutathione S-transferase
MVCVSGTKRHEHIALLARSLLACPYILLEDIGLPFALKLVSTSDGSTCQPRYLKLNPKGRVPVLTCKDFVLTEAPTILLHLAMSHPQAGLLPSTPDGLARSIEWFNWLSGTVHSIAIRQAWRPETFTADASQHAGIVEKGKQNLESAFGMINDRLSKTHWAVADSNSCVDPFVLVFYRWGNRMGFNMSERYEAWTKHTQRVITRGTVMRALAKEEISVWN